MVKRAWAIVAVLLVSLSWSDASFSQTESDRLAAAKDLMVAMKMSDQMNLLFPAFMQQLKPFITKDHPERERDFDALMPVVTALMNERMEGFLNSAAEIYARHFSAEEMQQMADFFRNSAGQKFLEKQPLVLRETMVLGQQFGQSIGADLQARMIEELRKRGHKI